jgi:hypothetical protein
MRLLLIDLVLLSVIACAGMPRITPAAESEKEAIIQKSRAPFLKGRWRLVHSISGTLPGGATVSMIGVSMASPENAGLHCTLMSIEGFVFLDAEYNGVLTIRRGIGPFKTDSFVMGIIRDVGLILFSPKGSVAEAGSTADGSLVCRYRSDGAVTDVAVRPDGSAEVHVFDETGNRTRLVVYGRERKNGVPAKIELTGYGLFRYRLEMDLIEAEAVR